MEKKTVYIYGKLVQPLECGAPAYIKEATGTRRTSPVEHFIVHPSGETHIETRNTRYILNWKGN